MKKIYPLLQLFALILLMLFFGGCGGSTQGTGGVAVEGKVLESDGTALANLVVTLLETGDSGTTDENGDFSFTTQVTGPASLLVEGQQISTQVSLGEIPNNTEAVRVSIEVERETNSGEVKEIEIRERRRPDNNDDEDDDSGSGSSNSGSDDDDDDDSNSGSNNSGSDDDDDGEKEDEEESSNSGSGNSESSEEEPEEEEENSGSGSSNSGSSESEGEASSCDDLDTEGPISALGASSLTVNGTVFAVDSETRIRDAEGDDITFSELSLGEEVDVRGECQGETLTASDIRIEDVS